MFSTSFFKPVPNRVQIAMAVLGCADQWGLEQDDKVLSAARQVLHLYLIGENDYEEKTSADLYSEQLLDALQQDNKKKLGSFFEGKE